MALLIAIGHALFGSAGSPSVASSIPANFFAPLLTTTVPTTGTDSPTFARASTAYVTDWEGIMRNAKSGEIRYNRARRVENLCADDSSEDMTASWVKSNASIVTTTSSIDLTAVLYSDYLYQSVIEAGKTYTISAEVRAAGGTGTSQFQFYIGGATVDDIPVDATWTRYSQTGPASSTHAGIGNGSMAGQIKADIDIRNVQIELVQQQADTNPAEYVSTHLSTHGAAVKGVKYFSYQNSVSVNGTTYVVTDTNPGTSLTGNIGVQLDPAITNLVTAPEDGADVSWTNTNLGNIAEAGTISETVAGIRRDDLVADVTSSGEHHIRSGALTVLTNRPVTAQFFAAAGAWNHAYIQMTGGGNSFTQYFNLSTGATGTPAESGVTITNADIEAVEGGYKCSVTFEPGLTTSWTADFGCTDTDNSRTATAPDTVTALITAIGYSVASDLDGFVSYVDTTATAFDDLQLSPAEFADISAGAISMYCEVYLTDHNVSRAASIMSAGIVDANDGRIRIGIESDGNITASYHSRTPTRNYRKGNIVPATGQWNKIGITIGEVSGDRFISVNGVSHSTLPANDDSTNSSWAGAPTVFWIGNYYLDDDTAGFIVRNVKTWQTALSQADLNALTI